MTADVELSRRYILRVDAGKACLPALGMVFHFETEKETGGPDIELVPKQQ